MFNGAADQLMSWVQSLAGSFCVQFARSPHVCVGFLHFPPPSQTCMLGYFSCQSEALAQNYAGPRALHNGCLLLP